MATREARVKCNVVIVGRDRHRLMQQCFQSLVENTTDFGLTVFDDGSEPPYRYSEAHRIDDSNHNLGRLKTLAAYHSQEHWGRGDWLCLADDDCYFHPVWLDTMAALATASEPLGFRLWGGQNHPWHMTPEHARPVLEVPGLIESYTLAGTHMFMRWATWNEFGPLESDGPGVCKMEDVRFCQRIKAAGFRIGVADPDVVSNCGLTQTGGTPAPGADEIRRRMAPGVLYE